MHIKIDGRKVTISRTLRTLIRTHLTQRLRRFAAAILSATVELSDRNGRRGGGDKQCRIQLTLASGGRVVRQDIRANPRTAFRFAMSRAENAVHRRLRVPAA